MLVPEVKRRLFSPSSFPPPSNHVKPKNWQCAVQSGQNRWLLRISSTTLLHRWLLRIFSTTLPGTTTDDHNQNWWLLRIFSTTWLPGTTTDDHNLNNFKFQNKSWVETLSSQDELPFCFVLFCFVFYTFVFSCFFSFILWIWFSNNNTKQWLLQIFHYALHCHRPDNNCNHIIN